MYFIGFATRYGGTEPFNAALTAKVHLKTITSFMQEIKSKSGLKKVISMKDLTVQMKIADNRVNSYTPDAAMTLMGSWFTYVVKGENPEFYDKLGSFKFPAVEDGAGDPNTAIGTIGDNFYHIAAGCEIPETAFEMMTYLLDDQAVEARLEASKIPPLKDLELDQPLNQSIFDQVVKAPDVQLWYDQALPPVVADVHKKTSQEIFGLTMTPEEANAALQEAMADYLD